jgi:signal transduction histidine kinase
MGDLMTPVYQFSIWAVLSIVAGLVAIGLFMWLGKTRRDRHSLILRVLLVGLVIWSFGTSLETMSTTIEAKLFSVRIAYLGVVTVPLAWLLWLCAHTERFKRLFPRHWLWLTVPAFVSILLAFSSDYQDLMWVNPRLVEQAGFIGWRSEHGSWWQIQALLNYSYMALGLVLLVSEMWREVWLRPQLGLLLLFAFVAVFPSLLFLFGPSNKQFPVDITPITFVIAAGWFAAIASDSIARMLPTSRARIVEHLPHAIFILDAAGVIVDRNEAARRLTELVLEARLVGGIEDLLPLGETAAAHDVKVDTAAGVRVFECRRTKVSSSAGRTLGFIMVFADRSAERQAESGLTNAVAVLDERVSMLASAAESRTQFLANISHELRAPLGGIVGFSELLKDGLVADLTDSQRVVAHGMYTTSNELLSAINNTLDLALSPLDPLALVADRAEPALLLKQISRALNRHPATANVSYSALSELSAVPVSIDVKKTRRICVNLGAYLLSTTPVKGSLSLQLTTNESGIKITFLQSGEGLRQPDPKMMYEHFWAESSLLSVARETLLGMAQVVRLIELHGGSLAIERVDTGKESEVDQAREQLRQRIKYVIALPNLGSGGITEVAS